MPVYLLTIDGRQTGDHFRELDKAKEAGAEIALAEKGKTVCIELPRAPAPTKIWCYHHDIGDWVETS